MTESSSSKLNQYWLLAGGTPAGPFTVEGIHVKLAEGQIDWQVRACPHGSSDWRPLAQTPGIGPLANQTEPLELPVLAPATFEPIHRQADAKQAARADTRQPARSAPEATKTKSGWGWLTGGGSMILAFAVVALARSWMTDSKPTTLASRTSSAPTANAVPNPTQPKPALWETAPATARIAVTATDGTAVLQRLANTLPPAQLQALGLTALFTGTDFYAIRVRIANTGAVPVRVFPENLRVHFGQELVGAFTADHPSFLQPGVVQPGYFVEGLVMYKAAIDVGAAIRLLGTSFSYDDPTITVTYGH